jgi:hypothetical protein
MKEREQGELTIKPVNPTLSEGVIFMPEPGGGEIPNNMVDRSEEKPQETTESPVVVNAIKRTEAQQIAWDALKGLVEPAEDASLEEKSSHELIKRELMERAGIPPIEGGSGEDEKVEITDELREYIIKSRDGASIGITNNLRRILKENGLDDERIDYFAEHPEEFRERLDAVLAMADSSSKSTEEKSESKDEDAGEEVSRKAETDSSGDGGKEPPSKPPASGDSEGEDKESEDEGPSPLEGLTPEEIQAKEAARVRKEREEAEAKLTSEEASVVDAIAEAAGVEGVAGDEFRKSLAEASVVTRERNARNKKEAQENGESEQRLPESLEDLAEIIMASEGEAWRRGGERELISENGEIVKENFLAWVRKRMWEVDDFNPLTTINLFSDIYVKRGYMQISFYEMISTGSYFLKRRREDNGRVSLHKDDDYEKLKGELIREVFTYNSDKNAGVTYYNKRHSEKEIPEILNQLWYGNPNLRADHLEHTLTLPSTRKGKIGEVKDSAGEDFQGREISRLFLEGNSDLGEGIRRSLLSYFHIGDIDMLMKIHGPDSPLFREKYRDVDDSTGRLKEEEGHPVYITGKANDEALAKGKGIKYDKDGRLVMTKKNLANFRDYINIYNDSNKDARVMGEVRVRMREYLMDSLGLDYEEARFAETWAYNKTYPMLIGARNDLKASAFDSGSRNLNTVWYREKQYEKKRKGQIGNIFDIGVVRRTSLTPLEEITDIHGRTIIEAIQGGQGSDYDPEFRPFDKKREGYLPLEFGQDEGQRWASMAYANADAIKNILIKGGGFEIEKIMGYDQYGRPIIDQEKADAFLEDIQKKLRYKWCTYGSIDYSKTVRVCDQVKIPTGENDRNGDPAFKTEFVWTDMPIASAYFGPEILSFIKSDIERVKGRLGLKGEAGDEEFREGKPAQVWHIEGVGGDDSIDTAQIQNKDIREYLWKHVEKVLVAKTIDSHRNVFSELKRYNYATIESFYDFFRVKGIFDKEDEDEVRKMSKTTEARLLGEEVPPGILLGMLSGIWKELKRQSPDLLK